MSSENLKQIMDDMRGETYVLFKLPMLETPHVIVAAGIAAKVGIPEVSLPLAFASHFLLDYTPHWNPQISKEVKNDNTLKNKTIMIIVADSFTALSVGTLIAATYSKDVFGFTIIISACFLAVLPDLLAAPYFFLKHQHPFITKTWLPFKGKIQTQVSFLPGIATQIVTCLAVLYLLA